MATRRARELLTDRNVSVLADGYGLTRTDEDMRVPNKLLCSGASRAGVDEMVVHSAADAAETPLAALTIRRVVFDALASLPGAEPPTSINPLSILRHAVVPMANCASCRVFDC